MVAYRPPNEVICEILLFLSLDSCSRLATCTWEFHGFIIREGQLLRERKEQLESQLDDPAAIGKDVCEIATTLRRSRTSLRIQEPLGISRWMLLLVMLMVMIALSLYFGGNQAAVAAAAAVVVTVAMMYFLGLLRS